MTEPGEKPDPRSSEAFLDALAIIFAEAAVREALLEEEGAEIDVEE